MKKIIYERADGGVSIVSPEKKERVGRVLPQVLTMTDDEYLQFIITKDVPADAINPQIVEEEEILSDKTNRHAWIRVNGKIEVDVAKVQAKANKEAQKESKRASILAKLKINEEELADILKR